MVEPVSRLESPKLRIWRGEIYPTTVKNRELIDVFGGPGETPAETVPAAKGSYD